MKKEFFLLLLILFAPFIAGCASATVYGTKIDDRVSSLVRETTTKQEVLTSFGNPKEILPQKDGREMLIYESVTDRRDFKWFGPNLLKRSTRRLSILLSPEGKLIEYRVDDLYTEFPYYPAPARSSTTGEYYYPSSRYGAAVSAGVDF